MFIPRVGIGPSWRGTPWVVDKDGNLVPGGPAGPGAGAGAGQAPQPPPDPTLAPGKDFRGPKFKLAKPKEVRDVNEAY